MIAKSILDANEARNIQISPTGRTLLHWLAEKDHFNSYKRVALKSGEVNPEDHDRKSTPKSLALKNSNFPLARFISRIEEDVDFDE